MMMEYPAFLEKVNTNLENDKHHVSTNTQLPDNSTVDLVASKTYFSWKGLVFVSQHLLVRYQDNPTLEDMQSFFKNGFTLGKKINKVPLLRGLQFGYIIIPIIATKNAGDALIKGVTDMPPKHWALFELPVIVDLATQQVHYFKGTAAWGAFFYSDMRNAVSTSIESVMKSS
jgi:hypothetical protein